MISFSLAPQGAGCRKKINISDTIEICSRRNCHNLLDLGDTPRVEIKHIYDIRFTNDRWKMAHKINRFFCAVDAICEKTGRAVCLLICLIMVTTTVEVVARYVFNHPTLWVWPTNRQLFGIFILFAGIYTMYKNGHIRVEILYDHFPPRLKSIARWVAMVSFLLFMVALILQGARMGWNALMAGETATGAFPIPLFPLKLLIPLTALLFLLEGMAAFSRNKTDPCNHSNAPQGE